MFLILPLVLILIFLPRSYIRKIRHALARLVMWQWKVGGLISARSFKWLWRSGDGKGGHL